MQKDRRLETAEEFKTIKRFCFNEQMNFVLMIARQQAWRRLAATCVFLVVHTNHGSSSCNTDSTCESYDEKTLYSLT